MGLDRVPIRDVGRKAVVNIAAGGFDVHIRFSAQGHGRPEIRAAAGADAVAEHMPGGKHFCFCISAVGAGAGLLSRLGAGGLRDDPISVIVRVADLDLEGAGRAAAKEADSNAIGMTRGHLIGKQEIVVDSGVVVGAQAGIVFIVQIAIGVVAAGGLHRVHVGGLGRKDVIGIAAGGVYGHICHGVQGDGRPKVKTAAGAEAAGHIMAEGRKRLDLRLAAFGAGSRLLARLGAGGLPGRGPRFDGVRFCGQKAEAAGVAGAVEAYADRIGGTGLQGVDHQEISVPTGIVV